MFSLLFVVKYYFNEEHNFFVWFEVLTAMKMSVFFPPTIRKETTAIEGCDIIDAFWDMVTLMIEAENISEKSVCF